MGAVASQTGDFFKGKFNKIFKEKIEKSNSCGNSNSNPFLNRFVVKNLIFYLIDIF